MSARRWCGTAGMVLALMLGSWPSPGMARAAPIDAPSRSPAQEQAEAQFRAGDYVSAAVALDPIARGRAPGDAGRARFWLGKSLAHLGLHSSALSMFDQVLGSGREHPYHALSLAWLVSLSRELPDGAQVLERISAQAPVDLDHPAFDGLRDEARALLGRHVLERGDHAQAIALLGQVPREADDYIIARINLGIAHTLEGRAEPAQEAFNDAQRAVVNTHDYDWSVVSTPRSRRQSRRRRRSEQRRRRKEGRPPLLTQREELRHYAALVRLGKANLMYMLGRFDVASRLLSEVSLESPFGLEALLWSAWAEFRVAEVDQPMHSRAYARALGQLHALGAPFFEDRIVPEVSVLEAAIYALSCRFDSAKRVAARFERRYRPVEHDLRRILDDAPTDGSLYYLARQIGEHTSRYDPKIEAVVVSMLGEPQVAGWFDHVVSLDQERDRLAVILDGGGATELREHLARALRRESSEARDAAGARLRARIERSLGEIGDARAQLERIRAHREPRRATVAQSPRPRSRRLRISRDYEAYRYTGEFWQDELGTYHFVELDRCEGEPGPP